jgi:hypothetical protein
LDRVVLAKATDRLSVEFDSNRESSREELGFMYGSLEQWSENIQRGKVVLSGDMR